MIITLFFLVSTLLSVFASDTLVVSVGHEDIASMSELNPHEQCISELDDIRRQMYDTLFEIDAIGNIDYALADDCQINLYKDDVEFNAEMVIECTIKKSIYFHDGEELTAQDVVFSINRLMKSSTISGYVDFIKYVEVENRNKFSAVIRKNTKGIENPKQWLFDAFRYALARYGYIVRKKYFDGSIKWAMEYPVGTGPLVFKDWKLWDKKNIRSEIILNKNKSYWKKNCLYPEVVKLRFIPSGLWKQHLLTGRISVIPRMDQNDFNEVSKLQKNKGNIKTARRLIYSYMYLIPSPKSALMNDEKLKAVLFSTIDRARIVDSVLDGNAMINNGITLMKSTPVPDQFIHDKIIPPISRKYASSHSKAVKGKITLKMLLPDSSEETAIADKLSLLLQMYGFNIKKKKRDPDDFFNLLNKNDLEDFDLILMKVNENPSFFSPKTNYFLSKGGVQLYQRYIFYAVTSTKSTEEDIISNFDFSPPSEGAITLGKCN